MSINIWLEPTTCDRIAVKLVKKGQLITEPLKAVNRRASAIGRRQRPLS